MHEVDGNIPYTICTVVPCFIYYLLLRINTSIRIKIHVFIFDTNTTQLFIALCCVVDDNQHRHMSRKIDKTANNVYHKNFKVSIDILMKRLCQVNKTIRNPENFNIIEIYVISQFLLLVNLHDFPISCI